MAGNTYVEKFNFYLHTFLREINTILPEFSEMIGSNYSDVIEDKNLKDDKYVKDFMTSIDKYRTEISEKNDKLFKGEESVFLLNGVDFKDVWCKDLSDTTRENIWKYLQTLYVLGRKIVASDEDVTSMLDELNSSDKESLEKHQKEMMDMINNMSQMTQDPEEGSKPSPEVENLFNNGIISDIAKELTNELDLDKMDMGNPSNMNEAFNNIMGGGGGNNFFNLISKVGEKIQKKVETGAINQGDLIKEAHQMMGGLKNPEQMAKAMNKKGKESTRDRLRRKLEEKRAKDATN
jgi:hypothetical protein